MSGDMVPMGDFPKMGTEIQYSERFEEGDGGFGGGGSGLPWLWAFILIVAGFIALQWHERTAEWNATIESNRARSEADARAAEARARAHME